MTLYYSFPTALSLYTKLGVGICLTQINTEGSSPKGLPSSRNAINYTVFCNQKQLRKVGLLEGDIKEHKLLVQGEPVLDLPLEKCSGRIGVTCFNIEKIEKKAKEKLEEGNPITSSIEELKIGIEETPPVKSIKVEEKEEIIKEKRTVDKTEIDEILENFLLSEIVIPEQFLKTPPRREKINETIDFYNKNNRFDKPVVVKKKTLTLVDGYKRYVAGKELGLSEILVKFI